MASVAQFHLLSPCATLQSRTMQRPLRPEKDTGSEAALAQLCSLLILLAGLVALTGLGLEDLPQLAPTRVSVGATFPAASPEVVEQSVTSVLEQQLNGLEGLESISSNSRQGGAS